MNSHDKFKMNKSGKVGQSPPHRSMGVSAPPGNANRHSQGGGTFPKEAGGGGATSFKTSTTKKMGMTRGNAY